MSATHHEFEEICKNESNKNFIIPIFRRFKNQKQPRNQNIENFRQSVENNIPKECKHNIINEDVDDKFKFNETLKDTWKERFSNLREVVLKLKGQKELEEGIFFSWIEADYWLFGLIYYVVFMGKRIKEDITNLPQEVISKINDKKGNEYYTKNSNRLMCSSKRGTPARGWAVVIPSLSACSSLIAKFFSGGIFFK